MSNSFKEIYREYIAIKKKFVSAVKKRLSTSIYPTQANDFFFLTLPKGDKHQGREVPCDWQLSNLVPYFWKHDLTTLGWNQGFDNFDDHESYMENKPCKFQPTFISFDKITKSHKDTEAQLIKSLPRDMIVVKHINYSWNSEEEAERGLQKMKLSLQNFFKKNPEKILVEVVENMISINFRNNLIPLLSEKINIKLPKSEDRLPGHLIIYKWEKN